tara:strand:- start:621 stop:1280 length:660 start_codon:yes stop_codon:yes gene_type:complete
LKLKKHHKLVISCDGGASSGKTTGAKIISRKYNLKFLSSGLLYRYASYQILKNKPLNNYTFLKKIFNKFNLKKLNSVNLHKPEISEHTSIIAKNNKIRLILKKVQIDFSKKYKKCIIEGRDISLKILPKSDIKFFFICNLDKAAKRRYKDLKKINSNLTLSEVRKSLKMRNLRDKKRKHSPLLKHRDALVIDTGKLNIMTMVSKMSLIIDKEIKNKYGS